MATIKWYAFHCNNGRNYRRIACGANQSEAASKLRDRESTARNLVCISECKTRKEAETCVSRIA